MTNVTVYKVAPPVTQAEGDLLGLSVPHLEGMQHPDGKPWTKCCKAIADDKEHCQCFMRKPGKDRESRYESRFKETKTVKQLTEEGGRFFCVHRTDGGFYRECAGWYAKIRSKFIPKD